MTTRHASPDQLVERAETMEDEARGYDAAGMWREATEFRTNAKTLRRLAREASANLGRMGE